MRRTSVIASNVSKSFTVRDKPARSGVKRFLPGKKKQFTALSDISFEAYEGDAIGVIGVNGSGKSTLMAMVAGLTKPTTGRMTVAGEASLLAVSAGLNGFLTGRENIRYKCMILGYDDKKVREITEKSIEFADVGDFIDRPMRTWSSGMKMRLGFAVSAYLDPDILVIDEALAVGDPIFANKCHEKILDFRKANKTIFIVSHSTGGIKKYCDKVLWLHKGKLVEYGAQSDVIQDYTEFVDREKLASQKARKADDDDDIPNIII